MSPYELNEIRRAVHTELAEIEQMCACHGTYHYCCDVAGIVMLTHQPVGRVLRAF